MKKKVLLLLSLILMTTTIFSQDQNFHIYLCFGQSNMEGQGTIESQDKTVDDRFKVLQSLDCSNLGATKGTWRTAVPPLCQCYSGLSPADYFGRTMIENLPGNITVGVINVAIGGCDIRLFDKDIYESYDATYNESWFLDKVAAYGGNPYNHLITLAKQAQEHGVIKGILLHQGETNTNNENWPSYVKKIYDDMMTDLSLDPDLVPIIAGEVLSEGNNCCSSMNTIINKLPESITNSHVVSSSGCFGVDNAHFNSAGYRTLGTRYAEKMLTLLDLGTTANTQEINVNEISGYSLGQNYPNPATGNTIISFEIPKKSYVSLKVFDNKGSEIAELAGKEFSSGEHTVEFNVDSVQPGNYIYKIEANSFTFSKKMIITAK